MTKPMQRRHEPAWRVLLAISRYPSGSGLSYTLSTRQQSGNKVRGEIVVNSSLPVPDREHELWTPAQTAYVVANELVLPGDEIWFTPSLY